MSLTGCLAAFEVMDGAVDLAERWTGGLQNSGLPPVHDPEVLIVPAKVSSGFMRASERLDEVIQHVGHSDR